MFKKVSIVVLATMLVLPSGAETTAVHDPYRPMPLAGSGYSDKLLSQGRWEVQMFMAPPQGDYALAAALYRAGLIVRVSGFHAFQVVNAFHQIGTLWGNPANEYMRFTVVAEPSVDAPSVCEAKKRWQEYCKAYDVEAIISEARDRLGRTPEQAEKDYSDAKQKVSGYPVMSH